ncbi:MAG: P-II family nitrogen regulator [Chloroflexota bacterium]
MKHIVAVIQPARLMPVRESLVNAGITGMTVAEVRGFGQQGGITDTYRGVEYTVEFVPKIRVDVVVSADLLETAVKAIKEGARTGKIGDGKIFVSDVEAVHRIRTEDMNEAALR